jgi:predicted nucleic acid-binding protein
LRAVLVDTCSFIDYFRNGQDSLIPALALRDRILLSRVVRLELLKGTRKDDRQALLNLFEGFRQFPDLPPAQLAEDVLLRLHGRGLNLGIADLLILADSMRAKSSLLTSDRPLAKAAAALKISVIKS